MERVSSGPPRPPLNPNIPCTLSLVNVRGAGGGDSNVRRAGVLCSRAVLQEAVLLLLLQYGTARGSGERGALRPERRHRDRAAPSGAVERTAARDRDGVPRWWHALAARARRGRGDPRCDP